MKNFRKLAISSIALLLLVSACNFSASTANIKNAYTARSDNNELQQTTVFVQDDVFYSIVEVANAPDDTVTKAMWYAVNAEGIDPNFFIAEAEFNGGGELTFDLTNNDLLWPVGKYKVEIYLDDTLEKTLEFTVMGTVGAAPGAEVVSTEGTESELPSDDVEMSCLIESEYKSEWPTIICDGFDDNLNGWYEGFDDSDLGTVEVAVEDGKYVIDVIAKAHSSYSSGVINWFGIAETENFVASIDGRITSKNRDVTWGFNFWGQGSNFYSFSIGKEGQYFMDVLEDGEWTRVMNVKTNKAIKWDDAVNNLTVIAEDGTLTFFVNGTRIDTYKSEQTFGNELSLAINVAEGANAKYYFDNALVRTDDF
jgi:hypothetical protein